MKFANRVFEGTTHLFFLIVTILCLFPFWLLISASITEENTILREGYSFIPKVISFEAYRYLFSDAGQIVQALTITILVTVIGTAVSLILTALLAYPLSRSELPYRKIFAGLIALTILYNGGLVPTYLVYTQLLDVKNTIFALLLPNLLLNGFYVLLARSFFMSSIPVAIIESAYMDGAGEFRIFAQFVLPLSLPILASIGLFEMLLYWNDWFNSMVYVSDTRLYSLQYLLNKILMDIQFLNMDSSGNFGSQAANIPLQGVRMAMAVVGVLPIILVYPFFQKYFVKGLTIGAVKG